MPAMILTIMVAIEWYTEKKNTRLNMRVDAGVFALLALFGAVGRGGMRHGGFGERRHVSSMGGKWGTRSSSVGRRLLLTVMAAAALGGNVQALLDTTDCSKPQPFERNISVSSEEMVKNLCLVCKKYPNEEAFIDWYRESRRQMDRNSKLCGTQISNVFSPVHKTEASCMAADCNKCCEWTKPSDLCQMYSSKTTCEASLSLRLKQNCEWITIPYTAKSGILYKANSCGTNRGYSDPYGMTESTKPGSCTYKGDMFDPGRRRRRATGRALLDPLDLPESLIRAEALEMFYSFCPGAHQPCGGVGFPTGKCDCAGKYSFDKCGACGGNGDCRCSVVIPKLPISTRSINPPSVAFRQGIWFEGLVGSSASPIDIACTSDGTFHYLLRI